MAPRDQIFVLFMFQFSKIAKSPKSDIWERKNPQHKIEENSSAKIKKERCQQLLRERAPNISVQLMSQLIAENQPSENVAG